MRDTTIANHRFTATGLQLASWQSPKVENQVDKKTIWPLAKKQKKKGVERSVHLFVFVGPGEDEANASLAGALCLVGTIGF